MRRRAPVGRQGPGLMGTMARTAVIAGTATATSKAVSGAMNSSAQQAAAQQQLAAEHAAMQQQLAAEQAVAAAMAAAPAAPAAPSFDEKLVQIQKLAVMKDQGLLTEEEFAAKKAQILGL